MVDGDAAGEEGGEEEEGGGGESQHRSKTRLTKEEMGFVVMGLWVWHGPGLDWIWNWIFN